MLENFILNRFHYTNDETSEVNHSFFDDVNNHINIVRGDYSVDSGLAQKYTNTDKEPRENSFSYKPCDLSMESKDDQDSTEKQQSSEDSTEHLDADCHASEMKPPAANPLSLTTYSGTDLDDNSKTITSLTSEENSQVNYQNQGDPDSNALVSSYLAHTSNILSVGKHFDQRSKCTCVEEKKRTSKMIKCPDCASRIHHCEFGRELISVKQIVKALKDVGRYHQPIQLRPPWRDPNSRPLISDENKNIEHILKNISAPINSPAGNYANYSKIAVFRPYHSTLNRWRQQKRIELENYNLENRLKNIKPTPELTKDIQFRDYKRYFITPTTISHPIKELQKSIITTRSNCTQNSKVNRSKHSSLPKSTPDSFCWQNLKPVRNACILGMNKETFKNENPISCCPNTSCLGVPCCSNRTSVNDNGHDSKSITIHFQGDAKKSKASN